MLACSMLSTFGLIFCLLQAAPQDNGRKGTVFVTVGQNRSFFTQSDVNFYGPGYKFKLENLSARDDAHYLVRPDLTQYVLQVGYFFHDRYLLSLTFSHIKYVMRKQNTNRGPVGHKGDFLERFEHTNGLNLIDLQGARIDDLYRSPNHVLSFVTGATAGIILTVTDSILFGFYDKDHLKAAGYGLGLSLGLMYSFFRYGLVRFEVKGGFIDIVKSDTAANGFASHNFWFLEPHLLIGAQYDIF